MLPEIAYFALLLAAALGCLLSVLPWWALRRQHASLLRGTWTLSYAVCLCLSTSLVLLAIAFALDDFSLEYVAQHSNSHLPLFFKVAAVWGGHEGSMLFFVFSLSTWAALLAMRTRRRVDMALAAKVLAFLGFITAAFTLFTLIASNPFVRILPPPFEGRDLNPMLQDIALIFHPPLLYLGYVGFAVNFAWAMAALVEGRLDSAVARWSRPWTLGAWAFLTLGIALGSWWAYYELGWGGWWFWDPVENASLLPWLLGTALLHATIAHEKRGIYGYAVLLLSTVTFALSILGTFIVRSGILSSVHAFAIDPGRGIPLLLLLAALLTVGLGLFALRADTALAPVRFSLLSKEGALGACIALLAVATACVLLGTLYPLIYKLLGWGGISVGAPYFNLVFVPLCLLALLLLPWAPQLRWKKLPTHWLRAQWPCLLVGTIAGTWLCLRHTQLPQDILTVLACVLASWVLIAHVFAIVRERLGARTGAHLAHVGVALVVIGAAQLAQFTQERRLVMEEGVAYPLGNYSFVLNDVVPVIGPNFTAEQLNITVYKGHVPVAQLHPQRRYYTVRAMNMNEVGLQWGWLGDFYVVPGDKLSASSWSMHLQYKPMVRWVWIGALCMALGAVLLLAQRRRSPQVPHAAASATLHNDMDPQGACPPCAAA